MAPSSPKTTTTSNSQELSYGLVLREVRAVSAWAFGATFFRIFVKLLVQISKYRQDCVADDTCISQIPRNWFLNLSVLADAILWLCPPKTIADKAPGFFYASTWLLGLVHTIFGVYPNIPIRISEMVMGRLTLVQLLLLLPVHFLCILSTLLLLQNLLPQTSHEMGFGPIRYENTEPTLLIYGREVLVNTAFCIFVLVVPPLLKVNRISQWVSNFFPYPIYNFGIDNQGVGCVFGPNVLFALWSVSDTSTFPSHPSIFGAILGGLLAGYIMKRHFPDDDTI